MVPMSDEDPVVQRIVLGSELRTLREAAGVGLDEADTVLGRYRGKLSKIENGGLAIKPAELDALLGRYGVGGPEAARVQQLAVDARRRRAPERVADWSRQYVALERSASEIRMVYSEVPGIAQTREHARLQLSRSPVVLAADVDSMAQARQVRGDRLFRPGAPRVWILLGEEALRRLGPREIAKPQAVRLLEMSELPNVSIRIVPFTAGVQAGLSNPFTLLWIARTSATIAYVETLTGADYLKTTQPYTLAFGTAEESALPEDESRELLAKTAEGGDG